MAGQVPLGYNLLVQSIQGSTILVELSACLYSLAWWESFDVIENMPSKKNSQLHHMHSPHISSLQHRTNLMGIFQTAQEKVMCRNRSAAHNL